MAELSVDDAQRLARLFLTGQAGDNDISRLQSAVAEDQGVALELLAQMQAALDDSAPAGLNSEQDRSVNSRIDALIAPRIKKRGFFSFITKLFKRKPKEEAKPTRTKRRGAAVEVAPEPAPVPEPSVVATPVVGDDLGETLPGGGMEEMAPIAAAPVATPAPSAPAPEPAPSAAAETDKPKKGLRLPLLPIFGALIVVALVVGAVQWWRTRPKAVKPVAPVVAVVPTPVAPKPTPSPTPAGRARRALAVAPTNDEPLPAEIKAMTPVAAGSSNINE